MSGEPEVAVTLSAELHRHMRAEARRLGIPLAWLVASLVVDTMEEDADEPMLQPAVA